MLSHFSHVRLFATLWTVAVQAPLSMGFSRQEYWSGLPCPPPGTLPKQGIELTSLMSPALAGGFFTTSPAWEDLTIPHKNLLQLIIQQSSRIQNTQKPTEFLITNNEQSERKIKQTISIYNSIKKNKTFRN